MKTLILSHDIGTTGDKAALFREDGTLLASAFAPYPVAYPRPGWAEQDALDYWGAFCRSTRELLESSACRPGDIAVVSYSCQMMAGLAVDREGAPLRPSIIWADQRSTTEVAELGRRVAPDRVYALTGHRLSPSYSATKIMWIRNNEPGVWARTAKFIHAKDFLVLRLTGRMCTDISDASGMNLLDIRSVEWSREMLEAARIPVGLLPELFQSTEIVGAVSTEAAAASGLAQGTPVCIGAGDGACATAGAGVVSERDAYICLGTSAWMATASNRPIFDPAQRTLTYCHFRRGLYFPCGSMQAAGGSLKWFTDTLVTAGERGAAGDSADPYELLAAGAGDVAAGSDGLLFLPYLIGERSPWWDPLARACFVGLTMAHDRRHMVRAVMEGVAFNLRLIADVFAEQGIRWDSYRVLGGAARGALWRQIIAEVLGKPVTAMAYLEEATSIGAAIAGGVGVGIFPSIEEAARIVRLGERTDPVAANTETYKALLPAFRQTYQALAPVFPLLGAGRQ
jgi:xylulokinase